MTSVLKSKVFIKIENLMDEEGRRLVAELAAFIIRDGETVLDGDRLSWEQGFRVRMVAIAKSIVATKSHETNAVAFWVLRNGHDKFDVKWDQEYVRIFVEGGKLHGDDLIIPGAETDNTLLMSLLMEPNLSFDLVRYLLVDGNKTQKLDPAKQNRKNQSALAIFLTKVMSIAYFDEYIEGSNAESELKHVPKGILEIFDLLMEMGYFSVLTKPVRLKFIDKTQSALQKWVTYFEDLNDKSHIKQHVKGLKTLNANAVTSKREAMQQRETERKLRDTMLGQAKNKRERCDVVLKVIQTILEQLQAQDRALVNAHETNPPLTPRSKKAGQKSDPERNPYGLVLLGVWEMIMVYLEGSWLCYMDPDDPSGFGQKAQRKCYYVEKHCALMGAFLMMIALIATFSPQWGRRAHRLALLVVLGFLLSHGASVNGHLKTENEIRRNKLLPLHGTSIAIELVTLLLIIKNV